MSKFALPNKQAIGDFVSKSYYDIVPQPIVDKLTDVVINEVTAEWGDFTENDVEHSFEIVDRNFKLAIAYFIQDNDYVEILFPKELNLDNPFDFDDLLWFKDTYELIDIMREYGEVWKEFVKTCQEKDFESWFEESAKRAD